MTQHFQTNILKIPVHAYQIWRSQIMTSKQGYYPIKKQTTDDVNGTNAG